MNLKIYCITTYFTDRGKQRFEKQKELLKNLNHQFIFGEKFTKEFVFSQINPNDKVWKLSMFSHRPNFHQKTYSCAFSHQKALIKFANDVNYDYGIIIEDDVILPENIIKKCNELILKYPDINIYHLADEAVKIYRKKYFDNKEILPSKDITIISNRCGESAACYLINKKGAYDLLNKISKIHGPADTIQFGDPNIYKIIYGMQIIMDFELQSHSTIGE